MKLTFCYLGVLTAVCLVPPILTLLGLVSKQWVRQYVVVSKEVLKRPILRNNTFHIYYETVYSNVSFSLGLYGTSMCGIETGQPHEYCLDVSIRDLFSITSEALSKTNTSDASFINDFEGDLQRTLQTIKVLIIIGLVLEGGGVLLAMTFWRRSCAVLGRTRWVMCATCWLASGILVITATFIGVHLNNSLHPEPRTDDTNITTTTKTAWALLLSGLGSFHAFVAGIFVLVAKCFQLPVHKYAPISLITYERAKGTADGQALLKQDTMDIDEEKVIIHSAVDDRD